MSDDRLNRIEDKIDKLHGKLSSIDVTLAKQHDQLEYHIKRTDLLEEKVKPLGQFLTFCVVLLKLIGVTALIAGIKRALA